MSPLGITELPLTAAIALFIVAGGVVWAAGTRLSGYAEAISERTGIGAAFLGALMLGGITSLPELATTLTASLAGHAEMAVNNIFGGVAMQVAVLSVADMAVRVGPISSVPRKPVILLQGTLLVLVLTVAMAGVILGEPAGWPVGLWSGAVFATAVIAFYAMRRYEGHGAWQPVMDEGREEELEQARTHPNEKEPESRPSLRSLVLHAAIAALAILLAGYVLTRAAEVVAQETGLGTSFVGVALLAASTSLPEVSTTLAAARLGRYDMAFSNVFGANLLDVALLFVTDLAAPGEAVLNQLDDFALLAALLAIALTVLFLSAIIRRRVHSVSRVGLNSIAVLIVYLAGLFALFTIR